LLTYIEAWKRLRDLRDEAPYTNDPRLAEELQEKIVRRGDWIRRLVKNHPHLYDLATGKGFDNFGDWKPPQEEEGSGGPKKEPAEETGGGTPGGDGDGGDGGGGGSQRRNRGGGGGTTEDLPGVKGKDYHLVRRNGRMYAVYKVKIGKDRFVNMAWRIDKPGDFGLDPDAGNPITKGQFKSLNVMGNARDIRRGKEGNRHPFQKHIQDLHRIYPNSFLKNREVMRIVLEGWIEKEDWGVVKARLERTDWYQNRTNAERNWVLHTSEKEKSTSIDNQMASIRDTIQTLFGSKRPESISHEDVRRWAEKIVSGAWGDPQQGFNSLVSRLQDRAEKIHGTPAWVDKQRAIQEDKDFLNQPEEMFEKIRTEAINMLGYAGRPDNEVLQRWANQIVSGNRSSADWAQYLRKRKSELYPYLDPNETWMDYASPYKQSAEELLGRTLSYKDKLLKNLTGQNALPEQQTTEGPGRLPVFEFEQLVRSDPRYWNKDNPDAAQNVYGFISHMSRVFNGGP
jgi:hypothetical protein